MIDRLAGRADFARLRAEGVRHGRGPIRLVSRYSETDSTRIAFAIPRKVGNAVMRNRSRRRIRAVLQELHQEDPSFPARGDHLIRVTAPIDDWSHATLRLTMSELLRPAPAPVAPAPVAPSPVAPAPNAASPNAGAVDGERRR